MDTGQTIAPLLSPSLFSHTAPTAQARSLRRHRTLVWLLVVAGIVSIALLVVALLAAGRSSRAFQEVNLSGSLRYRSLWVYGAARPSAGGQPEDPHWPDQLARMQAIRGHLHVSYPDAVEATDPAWKSFSDSLRRTGRVDWRTANAFRTAADTLTRQIATDASDQNAASASGLRLGLLGLLCALAVSGFVLAGLRRAEREMGQALAHHQESHDLFLRSINAMQEGYLVQDSDGKVLLCNKSAERLLGVSAADLLGREALRPDWSCFKENGELLPEAELPGVRALQTALPQESVILGIERPAKMRVWFSVNAAPVFHAGETAPYAAVLTFTDITAEKQTQEVLQKEREFQAAMLESLQSGVVACDEHGVLALFNRAAREFHGMPEEALPAEDWAEHFDLYRADGITPLPTEEIPLLRAYSGEIVRDAEMVIAPTGGLHRTVLASGQAIYDCTGQKLGAVVAMHDITVRRRVEQELTRLAAIVASSEEAMTAITLDGTLLSWNIGAERLYGYSESEVIGRHASLLLPEGTAGIAEGIIPRLLDREPVIRLDAVRRRRDGSLITVGLTFSPIHDANGHIIGVSCIARDITMQQQAEDALRESEARLRYLSDAAFEGIAVSQNGIILDANPAFLSLYGYTREHLVGIAGHLLTVPESRDLVQQKITSGDERAYEVECLRGDSTTFHAEVRGRTVLWNGQPARVTAVRDISERKAMEVALQESRQFAQSIADNSASIIYVYDLQTHRNVYANRNITDLLGYTPEQIHALGPNFLPAVIHPDDLPRMLAHRECFQTLEDGAVVEIEYRAKNAGGDYRWLWKREVVFKRRPDGAAWQVLSNAQDITERKALEEALRHNEEAMRAVLSSAPVVLYAADKHGMITLSEGTGLAALGLTPGEAVGRSVYEFTGADPVVLENTRRALAGETVSYDARFGALCLHVELQPQRDQSGAVSGIIGVSFDITERAQSEERFRVLFEHSSEAHFLVGPQGIIDCNQAAVQMLRCTGKAELLALHPMHLSPKHQPDGRLSAEKGGEMEAAARAHGSHRFEWTHTRCDGAEFPTEIVLTPVTLNSQQVILSVWHDLTEQKEAEQQIKDYTVILEFQKSQLEESNKELEALATTDGLTGLNNRRTFQTKLAEEHARAVRYHQPLSLLLLDVDQFKQYNDSFGHPAGDAVLQAVADALGHTARDTDVPARYGGEEFVVILPLTDEAGSLVIAERVRAAIAGHEWKERPVTVSVGVGTLSLDTPTPDSLVACADGALYRSKAAGRNRVTHGNPSAPPIFRLPASRAKRPAA